MMRTVLTILAVLLATGGSLADGRTVTLRDMIGDPRYWPPECGQNVCVLTGLGGIVQIWNAHVDLNSDKRFIVRGVCASACEIAARRANAEIAPGAVLIEHAPSPLIYR